MSDEQSTVAFDASTGQRLEQAYRTGDVVEQRRVVQDYLELEPGESVLDVGSGPGLLLREMAERVGSAGSAVGVDLSADMLALAKHRCAELPWVELIQADASSLDLGVRCFDAIVSTQVYEYVRNVDAAFRGLFELTRPGGRVAILDTDYDSFVLHTLDPERHRTFLQVWDAHFVHRGLPRVLGPLLRDAGFVVRATRAIPMCNTAWDASAFGFHLVQLMARFVGARSSELRELAAGWLSEQEQLGSEGRFFFSLNRYLVVADRPE